MKKTTLFALMISAAPIAAQAETVTGGLTLSYTQHDNDFGDMSTTGVDGRLAVDMDNGLSFGVDLGHSTMSVDGAPFDFNAEFMSVSAGYRLGNGLRAGVFADRLTLGVDVAPVDITLKTNGVELGYAGNGYEVDAFFGKTSLSVPFVSGDIDNLGVSAHYTGVEGLDVGATFLRARLSDGGASADIDFKGAAATYMVNSSVMVFGGIGQLDSEFLGEVDSIGLGASYDLGAMTGFASSLSLEVGRTSLDGSDLDVIRLGLSIPLGKSGPVLPMNSVADAILNPRHGALNAGLTAGF